jgi:hypothetical protein
MVMTSGSSKREVNPRPRVRRTSGEWLGFVNRLVAPGEALIVGLELAEIILPELASRKFAPRFGYQSLRCKRMSSHCERAAISDQAHEKLLQSEGVGERITDFFEKRSLTWKARKSRRSLSPPVITNSVPECMDIAAYTMRISCEVAMVQSAQKFRRTGPTKDGVYANRDTSPW